MHKTRWKLFFQAVAINIARNTNLGNINDTFSECNLQNIDTMMMILRKTFVNEILGDNKSLYTD